MRRQIDQFLIKNRKQAFFKNKIRFYDKEQVLYDAEINFHQIKRLLTFNSEILKNDPSIAKHYLDLMNAITRKKVLENSIANFENPEYFNFDKIKENSEENELDSLDDGLYSTKIRESEGEAMQEADSKELAKSEERKLLNSQVAEKKTKEKLLKYFEDHVKSSLGIKETEEKPKLKGKSKTKGVKDAKATKGKSKGKDSDTKTEGKYEVKTYAKTESNLKKLKDKVGKKIEKQNSK